MDFIQIFNELKTNPMFAGIISASIIGPLVVILKDVPVKILTFILSKFTRSLVVRSTDQLFSDINKYISANYKIVNFRFLSGLGANTPDQPSSLIMGYGMHFVWFNGPMAIIREKEGDRPTHWGTFPEKMTLKILGLNAKKFELFLNKVQEHRKNSQTRKNNVWSMGTWMEIAIDQNRTFKNIIMDTKTKQELINDLKWFVNNRSFYEKRGIPYKRGYMFYGPPGTGKTSTAIAISHLLKRDIYSISLNTLENDNALLSAFRSIPENSILLMEDIDSSEGTHQRNFENPEKEKTLIDALKPTGGITLSGVLNAIDGISSSNGRILIMTTNNIEKIDAALLRESRVDKKYYLGAMDLSLVKELAERIFDNDQVKIKEAMEHAQTQEFRVPSYWQEYMINKCLSNVEIENV